MYAPSIKFTSMLQDYQNSKPAAKFASVIFGRDIHYTVEFDSVTEYVRITFTCVNCGLSFVLPDTHVENFNNYVVEGNYIQDAFPDWSVGHRGELQECMCTTCSDSIINAVKSKED